MRIASVSTNFEWARGDDQYPRKRIWQFGETAADRDRSTILASFATSALNSRNQKSLHRPGILAATELNKILGQFSGRLGVNI